MNYFAHGFRYIDSPYFLAGTAVPDWLSVADRKVRMREKRVAPILEADDAVIRDIAHGIRQHLEDDNWFHKQPEFVLLCGEMTLIIKGVLGTDDGFRPSFLGHIVTEMLLDTVLIEQDQTILNNYYSAMESIDPERIESAVNLIGKEPTTRLVRFIELFRRERFLFDYLDMNSMLYRLNQVMRRVKLHPLPEQFAECLEAGRELVEQRAHQLLPATCDAFVAAKGR